MVIKIDYFFNFSIDIYPQAQPCISAHLLAQGQRRLFLLCASLLSLIGGGSTAVSPS